MTPTGYSLTVELDATALKRSLKTAECRLFPAYLSLITRDSNKQTEFKIAEQEGTPDYFDTLTPLYASFHEDDKTFSLMWTPFDPDCRTFNAAYLENQMRYGGSHGVLAQPGTPPPNAYTVSCVPWISFSHFAVHSYENKPYYFPSIESGKLFEQEGRMLMPLSITCHHATVDGWHVQKFLRELQEDMDVFSIFL